MVFSIALAFAFGFQQPIDGTTLIFRLEKDSITVQVGRWKLRSVDSSQLGRFVDKHIKEFDPSKILICGPGNTQYNSYAPILTVLKKRHLFNFKLVVTDAKLKVDTPKIQSGRT